VADTCSRTDTPRRSRYEMMVTEARHFLWRRCGGLVILRELQVAADSQLFDSRYFVYFGIPHRMKEGPNQS